MENQTEMLLNQGNRPVMSNFKRTITMRKEVSEVTPHFDGVPMTIQRV
jgi:hypothetical protein